MTTHSVLIAGGGPTGLVLAAELALAGVDVAIVERRATQELIGSRGSGLHARTIEVFDQRGIGDRFVSQGQTYPHVHFHIPLDLSDVPSRRNCVLGIWQKDTERILADWVHELPVRFYREREVTGFVQDERGVDVMISDGESMRAQYLVGCDGGRSIVRKTAGIAFPGWDPSKSWLMGEFEFTEEPAWGFKKDSVGTHAIGKGDDPQHARAVLTEKEVPPPGEPTLRDFRDGLIAVYGTDFGIHNPTRISRFTDMTRQAAAYRDRRVLLAGDAAHVHPPIGGQGLNLGVQDAMNLGWKLAQVVRGISPDSLLDTYHGERHAVGARVLKNTMALVALSRPDDRTKALGDCLAELLAMQEPRKRMAAEMTGLGIRYDFGQGHPLLGRRVPDLDLSTPNGTLRLFTLLHAARPALINFGEPGAIDMAPWSDRVQVVDAIYAGTWELPEIGPVAAPSAVLVRPDGYVAWVGESAQAGLAEALTLWFGPPARLQADG